VSYRPVLEATALRSMGGLPDEALDAIVERVARICLDPFDRMVSMPAPAGRPGGRMAELGDNGFVEFAVDEQAAEVLIYSVVWVG
jgi:hypothetical protein